VKTLKLFPIAFLMVLSKACFGLAINGKIVLTSTGCPVAGLTVEIDPIVGSPQPKVFTSTGDDGTFLVQVPDGRYLIQVFQGGNKVSQREVVAQGTATVSLSVNAASNSNGIPCPATAPNNLAGGPQSTTIKDWHPNDLAYSSDFGLLVVDTSGKVTRIFQNGQSLSTGTLFSVPVRSGPRAIASGGGKVFVTGSNGLGCVVFEWDRKSKHVASHSTNTTSGPCSGLASDGQSVAVAFGRTSELGYFSDLNWKQHSKNIAGLSGGITIILAADGKQGLAGDENGKINQFKFGEDGSAQVVTVADQVNSLALSNKYLLVASNTHLLCYSRQDFKLLNTPSCLDATLGGQIAGVRVDNQDRAWILLPAKNSLIGPITLK
jgi:hypothetical protein